MLSTLNHASPCPTAVHPRPPQLTGTGQFNPQATLSGTAEFDSPTASKTLTGPSTAKNYVGGTDTLAITGPSTSTTVQQKSSNSTGSAPTNSTGSG